jgi:hypothetical protein
MNTGRIWMIPVLLAAAALPSTAWADARDYPGHPGQAGRAQAGRPGHSIGRPDFSRRPHHRAGPVFVVVPNTGWFGSSFGYAAPPPVVYAPPPVVYAAPPMAYATPAPYYPPPSISYAPPTPPAPSAPPPPRVVEFDSGRYELRGDGANAPYQWVWVPNPPSAPPGTATAPRAPATVYRWTDERGVTTLTDDPNKVPPQFRAVTVVPR